MRSVPTDETSTSTPPQPRSIGNQDRPAHDGSSVKGTLVWDLPTRVFHWLFAACFAIAWLTAESERTRVVHVTAGYSFGGLLVFRVIWGLIGSRTARFSDFIRGPKAVAGYFSALIEGRRESHYVGHNPAGGWAILGLLGLGALTALSGWISYQELIFWHVGDWHEDIANVMLALVMVHITAVIFSSLLHGENLVLAMLTGKKSADASEGIDRPYRALGMCIGVCIALFWAWSLIGATNANASSTNSTQDTSHAGATHSHHVHRRPHHDSDDD